MLQWGFVEEEIGRSWDIYISKTKMADFLKITLIDFVVVVDMYITQTVVHVWRSEGNS